MGGTIRLRPILSEHYWACVEVSGIAILLSSGDDSRQLGAIFRTLSEIQIATSHRQL